MSISRLKYYGPALMLLALGCPGSGQKLPAEGEDSAGDTAAVVDSGDSGEVVAPDADGDGSPDSEDCYPDDPTKSPLQHELCNGEDDDCDGLAEPYCGSSMSTYQFELEDESYIGTLFFIDDIDGDGRDELLLGDSMYFDSFCSGRNFHVVLAASLSISGPPPTEGDGAVLAKLETGGDGCPPAIPIGDVDGDGLSDLVVGHHYTGYEAAASTASIVPASQLLRGGSIAASEADIQIVTSSDDSQISVNVVNGVVGDVDGDGVDDFGYSLWQEGVGFMSIVPPADVGSPGFEWQDARWTVAEWAGEAYLTGGGDTDGDGRSDVLVYYTNCDGASGAPCSKLFLGADFPASGALPVGSEITTYFGSELEYMQGPREGEDWMDDFNGDGLDELVFTVTSSVTAIYLEEPGARGVVQLGEGGRVLMDGESYGTGGGAGLPGDVNQDGYADLLTTFHDDREAAAFDNGVTLLSGAELPAVGVVEAPFAGWVVFNDDQEVGGASLQRSSGDLDGDWVPDLLITTDPVHIFSGAGLTR